MGLLFPSFFVAAGLLAIPILLHFRGRTPGQKIPFPSLRFFNEKARRTIRRNRLRQLIVLCLRCLIIALILCAFARPFWPFEHTGNSTAAVVLVDTSFSMQVDGRRAAIEEWLQSQLHRLRRPDQLGVILLTPTPVWLRPLESELETSRAALRSLPLGLGTTDYAKGLALAAAALSIHPAKHKRIIVAGDQQALGWERVQFNHSLPPGVSLVTAPVSPPPARQAAITALAAARRANRRLQLEATVQGFTGFPDERTITFYSASEVLGTQKVSIVDRKPFVVRAAFELSNNTTPLILRAVLDTDDLTVDNTAYAALPGLGERRIHLTPPTAAEQTDYLALALSITQAGYHSSTLRIVGPPYDSAWDDSAVAVLRGGNPFIDQGHVRLEAFLAAGGSAWILVDGSTEQQAWLAKRGVTIRALRSSPDQPLTLEDFSLDHPLFAPFHSHSIRPLLTPKFHSGFKIEGASLEILARWPDKTVAVAELATANGRLLITGFDAAAKTSTLPIEATFVPFVHQATTWLAEAPSTRSLSTRLGATLVLPGKGIWRSHFTPTPVPPLLAINYVTPEVPGVYTFEQEDAPPRYYAVNLDYSESELSPWVTPSDFSRLVAPAKAESSLPQAQAHAYSELDSASEPLSEEYGAWWWVLIFVVLLLAIELVLANRTHI